MCQYCDPIDKKDNEIIVFGIYNDFQASNQTEGIYCPMCGRKLVKDKE